MDEKTDGEASIVAKPIYKPLPPEYKPYNPTEKQKRMLYHIKRKKR